MLVAVVCVVAWGGARVAIAQTEAAAPVTIHRVQPGETLWGIVEVYYDDDGRDIRRLIQDVMDANGLSDATLHPGQAIELPTAVE
ncbi:MAG: LysM peptidoglycan-binding domain-containing protein [Actinobacteria bacterium]|nr:LysM peptidoglycan-binding domain-containing protein [Actinomycetota bacterium]